MMDFAHGPSGHFGGHPVPGLYHLNTGSMLIQSKEIKDTLGVDFRACENYSNGFEAAKKLNLPTLSILSDQDRMCRLKDGQKLANHIKNSEVHIIKNCGHMMLLEEADQTLAILKKFIVANYPSHLQ
jgi:pimeloyl-ACP methyl ester carboxylesterase